MLNKQNVMDGARTEALGRNINRNICNSLKGIDREKKKYIYIYIYIYGIYFIMNSRSFSDFTLYGRWEGLTITLI